MPENVSKSRPTCKPFARLRRANPRISPFRERFAKGVERKALRRQAETFFQTFRLA
jgi:hypothetical protein